MDGVASGLQQKGQRSKARDQRDCGGRLPRSSQPLITLGFPGIKAYKFWYRKKPAAIPQAPSLPRFRLAGACGRRILRSSCRFFTADILGFTCTRAIFAFKTSLSF